MAAQQADLDVASALAWISTDRSFAKHRRL